jgi:hypothetical protein
MRIRSILSVRALIQGCAMLAFMAFQSLPASSATATLVPNGHPAYAYFADLLFSPQPADDLSSPRPAVPFKIDFGILGGPSDPVTDFSIAFNPATDEFFLLSRLSSTLMRLSLDGAVDTVALLPFKGPEVLGMMMEVSHDGSRILFWPDALGIVHVFDLQTREWTHLDDTVIRGYMNHHKAILTEDDRIYAIGGYGFWQYRNLLLTFDMDKRSWLNTEAGGDVPPPFLHGFLVHLPDEESLLLGADPSTTFTGFNYRIHRYHIPTNRWTLETVLKIDQSEHRIDNWYNLRHHFTYKYDPVRGLVSVDDRSSFFDVRRNRFVALLDENGMPRELEDISNTKYFYSRRLATWIVIGFNRLPNQHRLMVRTVDLDRYRLTPTSSLDTWAYLRHRLSFLADRAIAWSVTVIAALGFVVVTYRHRRRRHEELTPAAKALTIHVMSGGTRSLIGERGLMADQDPLFERFLSILCEMKEAGNAELALTELDNRLFSLTYSSSQNTKQRSKLIAAVNELAGRPVIEIDQARLDRRYRVIRVSLDDIEIRSGSDSAHA